MKKFIIILLLTELYSGIYGQSTFDYLLKSKALIEAGNTDQSISILSDAINIKADYRLYLERASAYIKKSNLIQAISDFEAADKIEESSGSYGLARVYALKKDAKTALNYLGLNLNSAYKRDEKEIMLDPAFSLIENTPEWRLFWKTERYSLFETGLSELEYEVSVGNSEAAEIQLNSLVANNPDESGLIYAKALLAYSKKNFQQTIDLLADVKPSKYVEKSLMLRAKTQYNTTKYAEGALTYSELIKLEIVDPNLYYLRGECYDKAGGKERALSDISHYLNLYPESVKALSLAGKIEAESGDNIKALELFSKNISLHPAVPENYIDRANSYFSSSAWKYAVEDYSMALDLQPGNPEVYLNKGIALIHLGNIDDACHDLRQALKLGNKKATAYISKYCIK